ncbi:YafY family protein [Bulleidia sp. zg-1006]|uniref:helix-turn-helix transcriptional regulator n=1 Tax=Bulleidia sp. zg-1006 TaxID=2806552 RepID=UPI00193ABC95|nr:WYL domain-containing protein [Bulleidia sp. zg-1006]QRG87168.1 WYL domain-containing protein [Bulleidia sp. zg-1006]
MKNSLQYSQLSFALLEIFQQEANCSNHKLSMVEIISILNLKGYPEISDKTIRKYLNILKKQGYQIIYDKKGEKQGYYLKPFLHPGETFLLVHSLRQSNMFVDKRRERIEDFLFQQSSIHFLPFISNSRQRTQVANLLDTCLNAIQSQQQLQFHYFDYDIYHHVITRHNGQLYRLSPYALHIQNNHYYLIGYYEPEKEIRNYRLDKVLHLQVLEKEAILKPFFLEEYLKSNFNMYKGLKQTLQLELKIKEANPFITDLYERFEKITILKSPRPEIYRIAVKTAISPPLIAWLMQQSSYLKVISPLEVIEIIQSRVKELLSLYIEKD